MRLRASVAVAVALLSGGALLTPAGATTSPEAPVVAVIDSGVNPFHQEFAYGGAASPGQFAAWWDFTADKKSSIVLPAPGQTWDTAVADPYDDFGHGTLSAAMVGSLGTSPQESPSGNPGARLAVAKVLTAAGAVSGSSDTIAAAIRWAVDTVHADVINVSIGSAVPLPAAAYAAEFQAISYARSKNVLITVANGNGFGDSLVPGDPGWASPFACSPDVLAVGGYNTTTAGQAESLALSTDAEVVADWYAIGPLNTGTDGYTAEEFGTSFAAPFVAGFADAVITSARAAGRSLSYDQLVSLLKYSARDLGLPPQTQGYGMLTRAELPAAEAHAAAGTLPTRPSPDVNGTYVETVGGTLRQTWCGPTLEGS